MGGQQKRRGIGGLGRLDQLGKGGGSGAVDVLGCFLCHFTKEKKATGLTGGDATASSREVSELD